MVKIAKKLGFAGYRDFRTGVAEYNRLPTAEMHQELSVDDTAPRSSQKVFRTSIHALEETLAILDPEAFDRRADLISPRPTARLLRHRRFGADRPRRRATNSCGSASAPASSTTRT